jgi:hypothetical protein
MSGALKTDRIPLDELARSVHVLDRDVARLERIHSSQYAEIDRGRILAHIERVREAVEALRRDLAPDDRPVRAARPQRTTPKPEPQVNPQLVADYSAKRRDAARARREARHD